jgi:hypothetical protein
MERKGEKAMCFEKIGYGMAKSLFRRQHRKVCCALTISHLAVLSLGMVSAFCLCQNKKICQKVKSCLPKEMQKKCDCDPCDCNDCADDGECDPCTDECEGKRPPECEGINTAEGKIGDVEQVTNLQSAKDLGQDKAAPHKKSKN